MAKINLLPWRDELRQQKKKDFFNIILLGMLVTGLFMGLVHMYMEGRIHYQQSRNKKLEAEIALLDKKIVAINSIEEKKAKLLAKIDVITKLQKSRPEIVHLFDEIPRLLPDGVHLTKFTQTGKELTFEGKSQSNARVSVFMNAIEASAWLHQPKLDVIKAPEQDLSSITGVFVLRAKLGDDESTANEKVTDASGKKPKPASRGKQ